MDRTNIDRFEAQGAELAGWIAGLSAKELDAHPVAGAWSMRTLVVHMFDSDLVGTERMKRVIALQGEAHDDAPPDRPPLLLGYDENKFSARLPEGVVDLPSACAAFDANRRIMAARLRALPDRAFTRVGEHSESGLKTLADLVKGYIKHFDDHAKFALAKRKALGKGDGGPGTGRRSCAMANAPSWPCSEEKGAGA